MIISSICRHMAWSPMSHRRMCRSRKKAPVGRFLVEMVTRFYRTHLDCLSGIKVFSLPSVGDARNRRHIELGVKGPIDQIDAAWLALERGARKLGTVEMPAAAR